MADGLETVGLMADGLETGSDGLETVGLMGTGDCGFGV